MVPRRPLIVTAAVGAFAFAATSFVYHKGGAVLIDFERGYEEAFVEGFHPRERGEGKYFRWTDDASYVVLEHLPSKGPLEVEARLRTVRPEGIPLPRLTFTANGVTVHRTPSLPGVVTYRFTFPASSQRLRLGIESETFEAAGGRKLGVQVLSLRVKLPDELPAFEAPATSMGIAAMLFAGTALLAGLPFPLAIASGIGLALPFLFLLGLQGVRFTSYPREVALLAGSALAAAALLRALFTRLRWLHPGDRALAIALLVFLLLMKMTMLTYPLMLSSDADFQANRMRELLQGNAYPTSVTQHEPPFRIPYPVALYVVTAPLAALGVALVPALEITTGVFDVLVSGLLLFFGWRFLDDFRAGAFAAFLYQLVPMNALTFSAGNFTNLFAVAMLTLAFVSLQAGKAAATAGATFLALTAHFGLLLEGLVLWPLWILLLWIGPKPVNDRRRLLTAAVVGAFLFAGLYYISGYLDLFTSQSGRGLSRGGDLTSLPAEQIGFVFLATALLGSVSFVRMPLAVGWVTASGLFFFADLLAGIEIRYWLQALPLLALFSGLYLSRAFDRALLGKVAAAGALAYIGWVGARTILDVMLYRYH
jgi:hypothetical protein